MDEIMRAISALQGGNADARSLLLELWERWSTKDAPRERWTLAHFLADTEEDVGAELEWDLIALEAATGTRASEDRQAIDASLSAFLPSIHLNVGDAYRRAGDSERARRHAAIGAHHVHELSDDGYGKMIAAGREQLQGRLAQQ